MNEPKVNALIQKRNSIEAKIASIESGITNKNHKSLINEVMNLIDGVGSIVVADYYAPERYYSAIKGVKNIRLNDNELLVKVCSPIGMLLPNKIVVRGVEIIVKFIDSKNYADEIDY